MTDEQMDARLAAAGERWRADNTTVAIAPAPTVAETDPEIAPPAPAHHRRWGLLGSAAAVAAALVVGGTFLLHGSGNGPTPSGDTAALEGHVWQVEGQNSTATLYIDRNGNLVADDECRLVGGTATVDGSTLTVTDQVVRDKSCVDQYGPGIYESGTAVLDGASTFAITADALTISKDGKDLRFTLAPDTAPVPTLDFPTFVGTDWSLASAKDANGTDVTVAGDPTLHVKDDLTFSGSDGCNSLSGSLTQDAGGVTFGAVGGTETYCPGDAGKTESAILDLMRGTARWSAVGGSLTFTKGSAQLVYRWQPADTEATDPAVLRAGHWTVLDSAGTAVAPDATLCADAACSDYDLGPGTLRATDPNTPLSSTLDQTTVVWRIAGDRLYVYLSEAQGSAIVFGNASTTPPTQQDAPLIGTAWHLASITAGAGRYRNGAPAAESPTITFTDKGFSIAHTCYTQQGDVDVAKTTITISHAQLVDAHPCPFQPGRDAAAQLVDAIVAGTVTWSIDGGVLTITHDGKGKLVWSDAVDQSGGTPLDGTDWELETAVDQDGVEHPAAGQSLRINTGKVQASDGTNTISGPVTEHDSVLTFGDLATSAVGSTQDDPVRDLIDAVISGEVSYAITGDQLVLSKGSEQLIYRVHKENSTHSIIGTWSLTTIEHGTGPDGTASPPSTPITFTFGANRITVAGDCLQRVGRLSVDGDALAIGDLAFVADLCHYPELGTDESKTLYGVLHTCTWQIDGEHLTITKDGVGAIVLTRA